ncbi:fatty acid desaturase family protein [Mycobacteroides abscessus MAB_030201_1075]|uniref:Fatty acid desaturase family protein n=1 Tax=Mycobacteroides abscessus MAB_030201_1075 TaxID=1335410 RepID=A0A829PE15_9MYCO|nr:fatty acid desaturase family protein [Mycobacteroides abscessus MAB_030201_1075]
MRRPICCGNFWSNAVIFCGHFPDGAEKFTVTDMENETRGQWYLRQLLGSANFNAGPTMRLMSGNLCHQIEHHIYPDLPKQRLHEISVRVREICEALRPALHHRVDVVPVREDMAHHRQNSPLPRPVFGTLLRITAPENPQ